MALPTFIDISSALGDVSNWHNGAIIPATLDTTTKKHGYSSLTMAASGGTNAMDTSNVSGSAAATSRMSAYIRFDTLNSITIRARGALAAICWNLAVNASGKLVLTSSSGTLTKTGATTLAVNTWYRIAVGWTLTTTSNFTINVWLDGGSVAEIAATNADGTLNDAVPKDLAVLQPAGSSNIWWSDFVIDAATGNGDLGGVGNDCYVSAKLPTGIGSNGAYTTNGTGTGTGTGHAPYVNERPWDSTSYLNQTSGGSLDEDFAIQAASVGDDDLTGWSLLMRVSWQIARLTGGGAAPTVSIFDNGSVTAFTPPASFSGSTPTYIYTTSSTYPATAPIVGQRSTKGSGKVPAMAQCGIVLVASKTIAAAGRTTKNTRSWALGMDVGMNWRNGNG